MPEQIERRIDLPASPVEVWEALTDDERISEWFGAQVEMQPERGGRVRFRFPDGRRRGAVIDVFEPPRLLVMRWLPFEHDAVGKTQVLPSTNVRFSLTPREGGSRLVVQESVPILLSGEAPHWSASSESKPLRLRAEAGR